MTMPPPKVQALMRKQVLNRVQSLFLFFMRQNEFSMADDSPFGCLLGQMQGIIGALGEEYLARNIWQGMAGTFDESGALQSAGGEEETA